MLLEKTVQKRAITFLETYYNNRFVRRKIFAAAEVRTKKAFGGKRADGLLAFQGRITGKPYVVSLEAKSIKTLPAIKPYQDMQRWLWNSLRIGVFLCLASGVAFAYAQNKHDFNGFIPILICLFAGLSFGLLTWSSYRHQTVDVITQLKQYPANEQWLAFSKDAFKALTTEKQKILTKICNYRGIGLLIIGKNKTTEVLSKPKKHWYWFWDPKGKWKWVSDFLVYYSKEKEIRKVI